MQKLINSDRKQTCRCLESGGEAKMTKEHQETSGGTGNVNYFDGGDGLMGVYLCQNSSNCTLDVQFNV